MLSKTILLLAVAACSAVPSNIVRPCTSNACIARNLAVQSHCNPDVRGSVPSEYTIQNFRFDTPYFNSTFIDHDLIIRNHDKCFVSEFYYNLETKKVVLGLDCPALELESTRTVIQHASLREDMIYDYRFKGLYPLIRLTVIMPLIAPLNLCRAFTFADVTALPIYQIQPIDQKTADYLTKEDSLLDIFERETWWFRANHMARFTINSLLCDFGCN